MISLIATVRIKEGKMDEAVEILKEIALNVKKSEPGCLEYIPHRIKGDDNAVIFYEKYLDKEALKLHSANIGITLEKLLPLLEPGMDIKTCFEIA